MTMYVRIEYLTRVVCASFPVGGAMQASSLKTITTIDVDGVHPNLYAFPRVRLSRDGTAEWGIVGALKVSRGSMEFRKLFIFLRPSTRLPRRANPQVAVLDALSMSAFTQLQTFRPLSAKEQAEMLQICTGLAALLTQRVIPL